MLRKRGPACLVLCASLLLAAPASATVTYTFTSDDGDFAFTSPSFFEGGSIPGPGGMVISHSGNFDAVRFGASDIVLLNSTCEFDSNCFDATFLEDGIFQKTGTFFASDGDAKIVIADSSTGAPAPEPSTWVLLAIGLASLGFAGNRRMRGARVRLKGAKNTSRLKLIAENQDYVKLFVWTVRLSAQASFGRFRWCAIREKRRENIFSENIL